MASDSPKKQRPLLSARNSIRSAFKRIRSSSSRKSLRSNPDDNDIEDKDSLEQSSSSQLLEVTGNSPTTATTSLHPDHAHHHHTRRGSQHSHESSTASPQHKPSLYKRLRTTSTISITSSNSVSASASLLPVHPQRSFRQRRISSHVSNSVTYQYQPQKMFPSILRDADATRKLLDIIIAEPSGRRTVARIARTCKALQEPALAALWRDLDSFLPLVALFPAALMKRPRRPGQGLTKNPVENDWDKVIEYGLRVQRIRYNEAANNIAPSLFTVFHDCSPYTYILPNLRHLTWKVETAAGLERCKMFITPDLCELELEIANRMPAFEPFIENLNAKTRLQRLSITSASGLPEAFTHLLRTQTGLEKIALAAPGALAPEVGRLVAALPNLKALHVDLTGRSGIAVEGFFDEIVDMRSGTSTPSSVVSRDSGVFSADDDDEISDKLNVFRRSGSSQAKLRRKSSASLSPPQQQQPHHHHATTRAFGKLRSLQLTGEAANLAIFIQHLHSDIVHLELVVEDPPDVHDWEDLSLAISQRFGDRLQTLRIVPTNASKYAADLLARSATSPVAASRLSDSFNHLLHHQNQHQHLSLRHLYGLHALTRLEIDLLNAVVHTDADLQHLAETCPRLQVLRLSPSARFPSLIGAPQVTLKGLAPLLSNCKQLHTLALVLDATASAANLPSELLADPLLSSRALQRLSVGYSWIGGIGDALQVAIALSHLAPHVEVLRFEGGAQFHHQRTSSGSFGNSGGSGPPSRASSPPPGALSGGGALGGGGGGGGGGGVAEAQRVLAWQKVAEFLPHLQNVRLAERRAAEASVAKARAAVLAAPVPRRAVLSSPMRVPPASPPAALSSSSSSASAPIAPVPMRPSSAAPKVGVLSSESVLMTVPEAPSDVEPEPEEEEEEERKIVAPVPVPAVVVVEPQQHEEEAEEKEEELKPISRPMSPPRMLVDRSVDASMFDPLVVPPSEPEAVESKSDVEEEAPKVEKEQEQAEERNEQEIQIQVEEPQEEEDDFEVVSPPVVVSEVAEAPVLPIVEDTPAEETKVEDDASSSAPDVLPQDAEVVLAHVVPTDAPASEEVEEEEAVASPKLEAVEEIEEVVAEAPAVVESTEPELAVAEPSEPTVEEPVVEETAEQIEEVSTPGAAAAALAEEEEEITMIEPTEPQSRPNSPPRTTSFQGGRLHPVALFSPARVAVMAYRAIPSPSNVITFLWHLFLWYPLSIPLRILNVSFSFVHSSLMSLRARRRSLTAGNESPKHKPKDEHELHPMTRSSSGSSTQGSSTPASVRQ